MTRKAAEKAVVRAANMMIDRRGFMLPEQLGIEDEHKLFCARRNDLERAVANYRARLAQSRARRGRG